MDRRQLLFGASALGLVTNLDLNHPLIAQIGNAVMGGGRLSDRERAGLRGPVKTCSDFVRDDAESMSEAEYATDGRMLVWRRRTFPRGSRAERVYSYDAMGRLVDVTSGGSDVTDEFHYDEQGKKTRVRMVPPRPGHEGRDLDVLGMFGFAEEGRYLNYGGSVTTRYNDDDQPIESLVHGAHGELLTKIVHNYTNGRLISETQVHESLELPGEFQEQLRGREERRAFRSQMKEALSQLGLKSMERSYGYDCEGRVVRSLIQMANYHQDTTITYNEHGDTARTVNYRRGSLFPGMPHVDNERSEVGYFYQYDSHGNWIERTRIDGRRPGHPNTHRRTLAYY